MRSPATPVVIGLSYLLFVMKIGPMIMRDRKPFELKNVMIGYNALQIVLCFYIVSMVSTSCGLSKKLYLVAYEC